MVIIETITLGLKASEIIVKNYTSWGSAEELKNWKKKNN